MIALQYPAKKTRILIKYCDFGEKICFEYVLGDFGYKMGKWNRKKDQKQESDIGLEIRAKLAHFLRVFPQ